ncbi:DUF6345 domain-containing protein [Actinoplanes sp. NPDC049668]|uniref:DUF6345 domain-containing protein n=1 Tax=unclassified Actinoplanes TaxID=2626549 RepID=UPI0033B98C48
MFVDRPATRRIIAVGAAGLLAAPALGGAAAAAEEPQTVPVYAVVQEGLTAGQGAELAKAFGVPNALQGNGYFGYVDAAAFGQVPLTAAGRATRDESGRAVRAQTIDRAALEKISPVADEEALRQGRQLIELAGLSPDLTARPQLSHTELTLTDAENGRPQVHPLDTVVSYQLDLGGLPVSGQGAKLRLTVGPDGAVTQLAHALRGVERRGEVKVIGERAALDACARLYGQDVKQEAPTLGYQFPELTATDADGKGRVTTIAPQYTCNPVGGAGAQAHRLVPAVEGAAPGGKLGATRKGDTVTASVSVEGGTAPYTYRWSSSTTVLPTDGGDGESISYQRTPRGREDDGAERLSVEVTDADGLAATAHVDLPGDGDATAEFQPGGGGFGALAIGPNDVGIEQTIDEWQCAQDSGNGFRNVMASHGVGTQFDWRGASAWEKDFKDPSLGGIDSSYVDDVDATWYTGHGWPGGFTFKGNNSDTAITPSDARWGNRDLEWLQLESCQVLRDTNGHHDYFGRWRQAFAGLHIMNGFDTNAYCVGGGTGATFASYLFPKKFLWWELRPAYRVQSAWAAMAIDREPSGVKYRSTGLVRPDGTTNIGDYFWGQGPTGPDIPLTPNTGQWSISGTV